MTIIFDFDGTIADSFDVIVAIVGDLTGHSETVDQMSVQELRQQPLLVVARQLGVHPWKVPFLLVRGRMLMSRRMHEVKLYVGMGKVIEQLHGEGHELFILSSNSSRNVRTFLHTHHLESHFVDVRGSVSLFGKARELKRMLRRNNLSNDKTWYVGDETRDIDAAKAAIVRCIAVAWGFTSPTTLKASQPTAIAEQPEYIVQIINQ
ncbi:MAG TPA: HAD hydrolase-like protein [Candidatus Saccharimonadales bacterium]|nr:HAD hydrolase-like protein [Candidatus Saccharimonadales bacterium]